MKETIFITGGTGKVGFQLVQHFLNNGYKVLTTSRYEAKLTDMREKLKNTNHFYSLAVDIEADHALRTIDLFCEQNNLVINILINNARNRDYLQIVDGKTPRDQWLNEFNLNVVVPYEWSMHFAKKDPLVLRSVINISSIYGIVAPNVHLYEDFESESPINYGVSKAAQIHLTKELAVRMASKGIAVNCISFGGIKGRVDQAFAERYAKLTPSGDMLAEEDVIGAVDFFVSNKSKQITGHNLVIDGGWTIW